MHWFKRFSSRRQIYHDLSEEIQQHLEEKIEELVAGGVSRDEATQSEELTKWVVDVFAKPAP